MCSFAERLLERICSLLIWVVGGIQFLVVIKLYISIFYIILQGMQLEKVRFRIRTRPALYRNRSPLMRREGATVRLVRCCPYPRKE